MKFWQILWKTILILNIGKLTIVCFPSTQRRVGGNCIVNSHNIDSEKRSMFSLISVISFPEFIQ